MSYVSGTASAEREAPQPPRRKTLNIDLGPLRAEVEARAAAEGVRLSDAVRHAIQRYLHPATDTRAADRSAPAATEEGSYRPSLTARDAAKLDQLRARTGRRTRQGVLRALIDGIELAPAGTGGSQHLGEAVQHLIRSNSELVAIGRNLNQVAHSLNRYPGKTTANDRQTIERTVAAVYDHLEAAARLAAEIRPLVRLPDEPPPAAPRRARSPRKTARKAVG